MTSSAQRTSPRPLRADAERNRQRILAAAREVFARRGLHAGLDEIAKHAGVGTATVYRRYPDKQVLIEALFEDRFDQMLLDIEHAVAHDDPWEAVVELLEKMVSMQIADRGLKDVIFGELGQAESFRSRGEAMRPLMDLVLRRAQQAGVLRADITMTDIAGLQLMLFQVATFFEKVDPDLWRRHLELALDGLRPARTAPSELRHPPLSADGFEKACRGDQ